MKVISILRLKLEGWQSVGVWRRALKTSCGPSFEHTFASWTRTTSIWRTQLHPISQTMVPDVLALFW